MEASTTGSPDTTSRAIAGTYRFVPRGAPHYTPLPAGALRRPHDDLVGGREIDTAGDGAFATFEVPAQAVRCACAIATQTQHLGVEIRAGFHVGEVELARREVRGIAVHTGSRVCAVGGSTDVLVTSTLTSSLEVRDSSSRVEASIRSKGSRRMVCLQTCQGSR